MFWLGSASFHLIAFHCAELPKLLLGKCQEEGMLGWLCFVVMAALAYETVRRTRFELFYYSHITLVSE